MATTNTEKLAEMEAHCMTFGFGPRICPGINLAMSEAPFFIAHVVRSYDFVVACPIEEIHPVATLTVGPSQMPIVFTKRSKARN